MVDFKCHALGGCVNLGFDGADKLCLGSVAEWEKCDWGKNYKSKSQIDAEVKDNAEQTKDCYKCGESVYVNCDIVLCHKCFPRACEEYQNNISTMPDTLFNETDAIKKGCVSLEDRIRKLEKDLGALDELFDGFNLSALKVNTDFEKRIKALETVITHTVPYTDNAEQTKNTVTIREMTPQEKNPLSQGQVKVIMIRIHELHADRRLEFSADETEIINKLQSYLE